MAAPLLQGIRVVDFSIHLATPLVGRLLAAAGAEVIRIETWAIDDYGRQSAIAPLLPGGFHTDISSGVHNITMDLRRPGVREALGRLLAQSDVFLTSWSPRVLEKYGLDHASLRVTRSDLMYLLCSGLGAEGPYAGWPAIGHTLQTICGISDLSRFPADAPLYSDSVYNDWLAPYHRVLLLLGALEHRWQTGEGMFLESPLLEAGFALTGPYLLDFDVNGHVTAALGNAHPLGAPHGVYPADGEDRWVAITVFDEDEWQRLRVVLGQPSLAADARFATLADRLRNQDALDALLARWTCTRPADEVVRLPREVDVVAGVVAKGEDLVQDPQLQARGAYVEVPYYPPPQYAVREADGTTLAMRLPLLYSGFAVGTPPGTRIGEDNAYVLGELLGLPPEEIARLVGEPPPLPG